MNDLFKELTDGFRNMNTEVAILACWIARPVTKGNGEKSCRIAESDLIRVNNTYIVNCSEGQPANYQVLSVYGTLSGYVTRLECLNLDNNQIENLTNFN
jgi:hypothetical protein